MSVKAAESALSSASDRLLRAAGRLSTSMAIVAVALAQQHRRGGLGRAGGGLDVHGLRPSLTSILNPKRRPMQGCGTRLRYAALAHARTAAAWQNANATAKKRSKKRADAPLVAARHRRTSDALTLEEGVFTQATARARSRARSSARPTRSRRRKSDPYRSAMSMLVFYINRAGKGLSKARKDKLEQAKDELRALYGKGELTSTRRAARL